MIDKHDTAKATSPRQVRDDVQQQRDTVRRAADTYRANLIAAAPPQPARPAQSETQARRPSQRL